MGLNVFYVKKELEKERGFAKVKRESLSSFQIEYYCKRIII